MSNIIACPAHSDQFDEIDFDHFHQKTLQTLIVKTSDLFKGELDRLKSLSFITPDGRSYTYLPVPDGLVIEKGARGDLRIVLEPQAFSDFFHELLTISGLKVTNRMEQIAGAIQDFRDWEPTLRAIFGERPIYSADAVQRLRDLEGHPFDPEKSFYFKEFDNKKHEMRDFFAAMGYLHIKQVFSLNEVEEMRAQVLHAIKMSSPGDGKSWWSVLENGAEVPTRINYLNRFSEFFNRLGHDIRIQMLGKLHDTNNIVCLDRVDGPMVFIKSPNVKTGLANLLWHKDCGLGGHPIMCPLIQVGIQLDPANAENGHVRVVAGSHRYTNHEVEIGQEGNLPVASFNTDPGDVTLHFGDTLHCTPAPTSPSANRKVLYYKFEKPSMFDAIPAGGHYNDLLFNTGKDGRIATRANTWANNDQLDGDVNR